MEMIPKNLQQDNVRHHIREIIKCYEVKKLILFEPSMDFSRSTKRYSTCWMQMDLRKENR